MRTPTAHSLLGRGADCLAFSPTSEALFEASCVPFLPVSTALSPACFTCSPTSAPDPPSLLLPPVTILPSCPAPAPRAPPANCTVEPTPSPTPWTVPCSPWASDPTVLPAVSTTPFRPPPTVPPTAPSAPCALERAPWASSGGSLPWTASLWE